MGRCVVYLLAVVCWCLGLHGAASVDAHHGGIGIEGDLVEWALNVDQWQEERIDRGHRIKFLAYPRQPVRGSRTRLVFEIQAVSTGQYVGGLRVVLNVRAPDGTEQTVPLPETQGVTAYYETALTFAQTGAYAFTVVSQTPKSPFRVVFHRHVSPNALIGDWATLVGNLTVLVAFTITWVGLILTIQRRFASA